MGSWWLSLSVWSATRSGVSARNLHGILPLSSVPPVATKESTSLSTNLQWTIELQQHPKQVAHMHLDQCVSSTKFAIQLFGFKGGLKVQPATMHENYFGLSWLILMIILDDRWAHMIYHPCPCPCKCPAPDDSRPGHYSANGIARMSV